MRRKAAPCGFHCIKINHLSVNLDGQDILEDINLHIHCGTLAAIIGRNGAGKSTLLRAILGEIPHTGEIEFKNTENGKMANLSIGYVPQSININRSTPMDVYDLICAFRYKVPIAFRTAHIREKIIDALREFEADTLIDKPIGTLSGGELQRVLLSMAVMDEPHLLLLDEPVSGIDKNGMDLFYEKMKSLTRNHDMAVIVISHDLDYVASYADEVILLDKGVACDGTPKQVYESKEFGATFGGSYDYGALAPKNIPLGRKGAGQ